MFVVPFRGKKAVLVQKAHGGNVFGTWLLGV